MAVDAEAITSTRADATFRYCWVEGSLQITLRPGRRSSGFDCFAFARRARCLTVMNSSATTSALPASATRTQRYHAISPYAAPLLALFYHDIAAPDIIERLPVIEFARNLLPHRLSRRKTYRSFRAYIAFHLTLPLFRAIRAVPDTLQADPMRTAAHCFRRPIKVSDSICIVTAIPVTSFLIIKDTVLRKPTTRGMPTVNIAIRRTPTQHLRIFPAAPAGMSPSDCPQRLICRHHRCRCAPVATTVIRLPTRSR